MTYRQCVQTGTLLRVSGARRGSQHSIRELIDPGMSGQSRDAATVAVHEHAMPLPRAAGRPCGQCQVHWQKRAHFFAVSAQIMRRILADHARRRKAAKRGDQVERVPLAHRVAAPASDAISVLALDRALERLEGIDHVLARIVELRAFGGLTIDETARPARAWLVRKLGAEGRP